MVSVAKPAFFAEYASFYKITCRSRASLTPYHDTKTQISSVFGPNDAIAPGYPKAALFGFCTALVAFNIVAVVKGAIRAVWGASFVEDQLSMYYLTLEVAQVTKGMMIAVPTKDWEAFRSMTAKEFADTMTDLARNMETNRYTKHKRGPKNKPPKKISGKYNHHISTARILSARP